MSVEELKKKANGENDTQTADITNDNKALEESERKRKEAEARAAEAEFESSFKDFSSTYPHAKEYRDAIKEKVKNGYSVQDAVTTVLVSEKKFLTQEDIDREAARGTDLGGSGDHGDLTPRDSVPKDLAEAEKAFKDAEAKGEIFFS